MYDNLQSYIIIIKKNTHKISELKRREELVNMNIVDQVMFSMIEFDKGDARRIQHFIKVYEFARLIGIKEELDKETQFILECASILHDIGILPALEKYGDCSGKLQEKEGPYYAEKLLEQLNIDSDIINRVSYLIGHHHTYNQIDGMDYQILVEADFLVNIQEEQLPKENIEKVYQNIFRTETGKNLMKLLFDI